jgi:hypothetical protein
MLLEKKGFTQKTWIYVIAAIVLHIAFMLIAPNQPLQGPHKIRQADTLFSSYSYCKENADFLRPRIMHREGTNGVAVGEFPLYNYVMSMPCKVTGVWSVSVLRAITFLFFVLNFFLIGFTLIKAWGRVRWEWLTLFWFFTPLWFVYGPMPIPDGFTLALFLWAWNSSLTKKTKIAGFFQNLLLVLVFLIRPYFFPLFWLVRRDIKRFIILTALCALGYLVWFKWWVPQVTEIDYYAISNKPMRELFENWWPVVNAFVEQTLYHHVNYIGAILFIAAIMKEKELFLCWCFAWAFILAVKADHFVNHPYYMISAAFFALLLMLKSDFFDKAGKKATTTFAVLYVIVCIAGVQHHYFRKADWIYQAGEKVQEQTQFSEKIAMYGGRKIVYFYAALRTGWTLPYEDFKNGEDCPQGAVWAWHVDEGLEVSDLVKCISWK